MKLLILITLLCLSSPGKASVFQLTSEELLQKNLNNQIELCWWGGESSTIADLKQNVEAFLAQEIQGRGGVSLYFHADCMALDDPFFPVGLAVYDDPELEIGLKHLIDGMAVDVAAPGHPTSFFAGIWVHQQLVDVALTHSFQGVAPSLESQILNLDESGRKNLLLSIALHEVLHAFGFVHEQHHKDSTCEIKGDTYSSFLHELLTPYDAESIMNYCLTHFHDFNDGLLGMSEPDITGLRLKY